MVRGMLEEPEESDGDAHHLHRFLDQHVPFDPCRERHPVGARERYAVREPPLQYVHAYGAAHEDDPAEEQAVP